MQESILLARKDTTRYSQNLGLTLTNAGFGQILITAMWYKKGEQPPRIGLWYVGTGTGTIIGALASFGFQHYTSKAFTSW